VKKIAQNVKKSPKMSKNRPKCKKIAQNVNFLSKLMPFLNRGKKYPKKVGYFLNFQNTARNKQSRNGRKFSQSGHPALVRPVL
jgi:hypothetical protein